MATQINGKDDIQDEPNVLSIEFDEFDEELQSLNELLEGPDIRLHDESFSVPVKSLNLQKAITISAGSSLRQCVDKMLARHIGCMLVVKAEKLCGIFTERDALLKVAGENVDLDEARIDDYMTHNIIAVKMTDPLIEVIRLMHEGRYRHVPVVDDDKKPLAVVSIKDIIHFMVEFFPQDVLNLPPHPIRVGTKNREGG